MSNKVFEYIEETDSSPIDWSKPDYTGENADYYLHKYVNRPEDAANLEDFQKVLWDMGIVSPPADALNAAITGQVELMGAGATYRNANLAADLSITEVDVDFNGSTIQYAQPLIILPVATNNIYVGVTTTINHATNFDAGRYNIQIEYTVL